MRVNAFGIVAKYGIACGFTVALLIGFNTATECKTPDSLDYISPDIKNELKQRIGKPWTSQSSLDQFLLKAKRVKIFGGYKMLTLDTSDEIQTLRQCLSITGERVSCELSVSTMILECFDSGGGLLGKLECIGTDRLRWSGWCCETYLAKPLELSRWLSGLGLTVLEDKRASWNEQDRIRMKYIGKKRSEVIRMLGQPNEINSGGLGTEKGVENGKFWEYYKNRRFSLFVRDSDGTVLEMSFPGQ